MLFHFHIQAAFIAAFFIVHIYCRIFLLLHNCMKRFLVLILSVLYMASAMGFTVQQHYCMGKLVSAGFTDDGKDECSINCCDATLKKDCCKD